MPTVSDEDGILNDTNDAVMKNADSEDSGDISGIAISKVRQFNANLIMSLQYHVDENYVTIKSIFFLTIFQVIIQTTEDL